MAETNLSGPLVVPGGFTGDITGDQTLVSTAKVASEALGDVDFPTTLITLNGTAACVITGWTPTVGKVYIITCVTSVSNSPTLTLSSGITWEGTNDLATFDAVGETLTVVCVSATRLMIISNPDTVAFT